ncbi:hypothetical protein [Streptomyces gramineus]|uniref:hypothetical protein n=1 Tax=Streptomyces gramineus TaxID=910542 RepID=UPI00398ADDEF
MSVPYGTVHSRPRYVAVSTTGGNGVTGIPAVVRLTSRAAGMADIVIITTPAWAAQ